MDSDTGHERERRGSLVLVGSRKRRREESTEHREAGIRVELKRILLGETSKIPKGAAKCILELFGRLEQENILLKLLRWLGSKVVGGEIEWLYKWR